MKLELIPPAPEHVPALAEILFRAFKDLYDRHGLPPDIPSVEFATAAMNMFVTRPDFYGVVARQGGEIVGSNFTSLTDPVAGVGPITVKPGVQSKGIGRALMQNVVNYAIEHHGPQVRLVQDAINMVSLSLYTSLGFDVREPLVLLTMPRGNPDPAVRRVTASDIDACDELCRRVYKVSRKNELAGCVAHGAAMGLIPFLRERGGRIVGCAVPAFFGFGVAETNEDLMAIFTTAVPELPPGHPNFLCPSRNGDLYRRCLKAGSRAIRALHVMSIGPYESPEGAWFPSIAY